MLPRAAWAAKPLSGDGLQSIHLRVNCRPMKESIHAYLIRRLEAVRGQHSLIAQETGVPQSTVSRICLGIGSPRLDRVQPLLDWFAAADRKAEQRARRAAARAASRPVQARRDH